MRVTLNEGLKIRSRLTGEIAKVDQRILSNNATVKGSTALNVQNLLDRRRQLVDTLVDVKVAIFRANLDQQEMIIRLAELKAELAMLDKVPTTDGPVVQYGGQPVVWVTQIGRQELDEMVARLQDKVDSLQRRLEHSNHNKMVEVSDFLDPAGGRKL